MEFDLQSRSTSLIREKLADNPRPFISVALPTFRRPHIVQRAIESVLRQDFEDWELVVSDDGGPDAESWGVVERYAARDHRVRLVENRGEHGQVGNTNNAMLASRGRWIKLLHDDDWLAPGALRKFAAAARKHPAVAFVSCGVNVVDGSRLRMYKPPRHEPPITVYAPQQCLIDLYLVRTTRFLGLVPSTLMVNRNAIEAGCLMRVYKSITSGVDQVFSIDLASHGALAILHEGLVFYDGSDHDSITAATSFEQVDRETLDLKQLTWSLIKNRRDLPAPETVLRALRVARLRRRFRKQPLRQTVRDALELLRPSVMKVARDTLVARLQRSFV